MNFLRLIRFRRFPYDWQHIVLLLCLLVMMPLVTYNMVGWVRLLVFPGEANFGEGMLLAEAMRLARGENIYGSIGEAPYWVGTYPPLYQLLIAPLGWSGFWWPRTISFLATCGQLSILVMVARRLTGSTLVGLVACAIWINTPCVNAWAVIGRTDTLGRFLQSACVASALLMPSVRRATIWAMAFGTLAMLTKQNMFSGGMVAAFILWQRGGWAGVRFAFGWVGITTLLYGVIELASGGGFFQHILDYTSRGVDFKAAKFWVVDFFWSIHWPYVCTAVPGVMAAGLRKDSHWLVMALLAGVPNMIMTGNSGADRNYFFDVLWAVCLLVPVGVWHFGGWASRGAPWWRIGVGAMVGIVVLGLLSLATRQGFTLFKMPYPGQEERQRARKVVDRLTEIRKPLLCEPVGYQILAGEKPAYAPYIMKMVADKGVWDPSPIVSNLQQKRYGGVVLTKYDDARFPEIIRREIRANYHPAKVFPANYLIEETMDFTLYLPNE